MNKKIRKIPVKPTLREYVLVPITDPAQQAMLDRMRKEATPTRPAAVPNGTTPKLSKRG